ncbi:hypothetical protein Bbelb_076610 [Branchiostoma belcheri]|nr:hypothetical protein Bbelb_076610 [Branchiostoma belcheri]
MQNAVSTSLGSSPCIVAAFQAFGYRPGLTLTGAADSESSLSLIGSTKHAEPPSEDLGHFAHCTDSKAFPKSIKLTSCSSTFGPKLPQFILLIEIPRAGPSGAVLIPFRIIPKKGLATGELSVAVIRLRQVGCLGGRVTAAQHDRYQALVNQTESSSDRQRREELTGPKWQQLTARGTFLHFKSYSQEDLTHRKLQQQGQDCRRPYLGSEDSIKNTYHGIKSFHQSARVKVFPRDGTSEDDPLAPLSFTRLCARRASGARKAWRTQVLDHVHFPPTVRGLTGGVWEDLSGNL